MSRRHLTFACETEQLVGTLDDADGAAGLLIVTGGNETRAGAFSGQAQLAARIAAEGYPVFRFDRRGVGDSSGPNEGFRQSGRCIAAAIATFLVEKPSMRKVVGFGNCDAASALMLFAGAGCQSLVLANPWTFEDDDQAAGPPPEAIRSRYASKLKDPREIARLFKGGVSLRKLAKGLSQAVRPAPPSTGLAQEMRSGLATFEGPIRILLAENDRTAQAFRGAWPDADCSTCSGADHAFGDDHARDWIFNHLVAALEE